MSSQGEKGSFKADIPEDLFREAERAVEKHEGDGGGAEVQLEGPEAAPAEPEETAKLRQQVRTLQAMLEDSAARARETQERLKDNHERLLRTAADLDNYKKRVAREKDEQAKYVAEKLFKDLLPVVDNLERALATAEGAGASGPLADGVRLVTRQFLDALGRHGVKQFSAEGQPFDPAVHEALMQQETTQVPPGHVAAQMLKGYRLHDRLLRPAAVSVARAPAEAAAPPAEPAGAGPAAGEGADGQAGGRAPDGADGAAPASAGPAAGPGDSPGGDR